MVTIKQSIYKSRYLNGNHMVIIVYKKIKIMLISFSLLILAAACTMDYNIPGQTSGGQAKVYFTITDAAADMGAVSEVKVTVDNINVQSESRGWVNVASDTRTYNLLELEAENAHELIADADLETGNYSQIRFDVTNVIVIDNEGEHEAKLPSEMLRINAYMEVKENSTTSVSLDFKADQSLHVTGNGQYIMAPVIQVETRENANINVQSNNRVQITGGNVKTNIEVGMNEKGEVGVGLNIPENANISIDAGIGAGLGNTANIRIIGNQEVNQGNDGSGLGIESGIGGNLDI